MSSAFSLDPNSSQGYSKNVDCQRGCSLSVYWCGSRMVGGLDKRSRNQFLIPVNPCLLSEKQGKHGRRLANLTRWGADEFTVLLIVFPLFVTTVKSNTEEYNSAYTVEAVLWAEPKKAYQVALHTSLPMIPLQNKRHEEPKKIYPDWAFQSPDNIKPAQAFPEPA